MASFFNQATLVFGGRRSNSNTTEGEVIDVLTLTKTAISENYGRDDAIAYAVSIVNTGNEALNGISFTDNLGAYTVGAASLYPLDYVDGSIKYFVGGTLMPSPTVEAGAPLVISGINVPAGSNALIVYEARPNEFAPLASGSVITNTVTAGTAEICSELSATASVPVREEALPFITKFASDTSIACGSEISYTFVLQNLGNAPVVATDDLTVEDLFNPILNISSVTLDGATLSEGTDYSYEGTTGEFRTLPGVITIPAASYTQDAQTGVITATPGVAILTVTGTV